MPFNKLLAFKFSLLLLILVSIVLAGCTTPGTTTPAGTTGAIPTSTQSSQHETPLSDIVQFTVLYTSDEHGWMEGQESGQGAAGLVGLWREDHDYTPGGPFLVLSGGDNWTGPAISTWFDGQSMVEVMNAMGYTASAIGNHEFDFGLEAMTTRFSEANFTHLSANIREKSTGEIPVHLGFQPYTLVEVAGLSIGLVGLSYADTPSITDPAVTGGFEFISYEDALREFVPQVRARGADLVFVLGHLCGIELTLLAHQVEDLEIPLFTGGHCHELYAETIADAVLLGGGELYESYAYADITYDRVSQQIQNIDAGTAQNRGGPQDEDVSAIVERWHDEAEAELNLTIGYLKADIPRQSRLQQDLITETWLIGYPGGDVALTNLGGMRDRIPAGEVTLASIISVMPFDNTIVDVRLTGEQLIEVLNTASRPPAIGGMHREHGTWVLNESGEQLDPRATYSVLVNSFMYAGGDDYTLFAEYDPQAYQTAIDWRQPVTDWIIAQNSSPEDPMDDNIEGLAP